MHLEYSGDRIVAINSKCVGLGWLFTSSRNYNLWDYNKIIVSWVFLLLSFSYLILILKEILKIIGYEPQ